jgi:sodium transport system permease protein
MLAVGAMHPAVDTTAGERENGTWETLMTTATSRANILLAKYLYVSTMAFVAGALNVIAMMFSLRAIIAPLAGNAANGNLGPSFQVPLASVPVLVAGAALLALFVSAGMMILASFARTFKEGQSLVSPFYIALVLPITFIQGPAQEFTLQSALIPVVNVAMMFRQAIIGSYDWNLIAVTVVVEAVCILAALKIAAAIIQHEDFVTGSYTGTFGKFVKERLWRTNPSSSKI